MASDFALQFSSVLRCTAAEIYFATTLEIIAAKTVFAVLHIVLSFFGTLANGLVIMAYYRNLGLRTIQNTIFFVLAITDIGVTAFLQPTYVAAELSSLLGKRYCLLWDIVSLSSMALIFLSLVTIVILSLQSYITLAYPYRFQSIITIRRLKIMVIGSWVFTLASTITTIFYPPLNLYLSICFISSTIITVVFTWIWTYKLVARHRKAIQTTQTPSVCELVSRKRILRSTVTALAVVLSLLGCYCFGLCFIFFKMLLNTWKINHNTNLLLSSVTTILMYLNSVLNPCLVFLRNSSFREEIKKIVFN